MVAYSFLFVSRMDFAQSNAGSAGLVREDKFFFLESDDIFFNRILVKEPGRISNG